MNDKGGRNRKTVWAMARRIRKELRPTMSQRDVAKILCCSQQAVDQTELRALRKILNAFESERVTETINA